MKAAIYSRGLEVEQEGQLLTLLEELTRNHFSICLYKSLVEQHSAIDMLPVEFSVFSRHEDLDESFDFVISLGGDGTMLDSATLVRHKNIPILGINFGRLGFLASLGQDEMSSAVESLVAGSYMV